MAISGWKYAVLTCAFDLSASCCSSNRADIPVYEPARHLLRDELNNRPNLAGIDLAAPVITSPAVADRRTVAAAGPKVGMSVNMYSDCAASRQYLEFDERILAAQNRERARLGLRPLSWNGILAQKGPGVG